MKIGGIWVDPDKLYLRLDSETKVMRAKSFAIAFWRTVENWENWGQTPILFV